MAETRSPDAIQREIEATRAELADTIDAIAERVSPKKAASRGAQAMKAKATAALGGAERAVSDVAGKAGSVTGKGAHEATEPEIVAQQTTQAESGRLEPQEPSVLRASGETIVNGRPASVLDAAPEQAAHHGGRHVANLQQRTLRTDRVLLSVGLAAAAVGAIVLIRSRHH